ncbi:formimidoylglutamase [Aquimarina rhabdastrellae]
MSFEFLTPVNEEVLIHASSLPEQTIGSQIKIHTQEQGIPNLEGIKIVIIGISENRNGTNFQLGDIEFTSVRKAIYELYQGNWSTPIADLGDILPGDEVADTYYVIKEILGTLLRKDIIPIILGGSQDLTYAQYRAYDVMEKMVNLVNVDARFDLGDSSQEMTNKSFVSKIIVDQPYNLFNYSNLGYQTYFNAQEEINLIEKLYFDAVRLGEIIADISVVEPVMRDADIVSIDLSAINSNVLSSNTSSPNGFNGREICAIARYAGISDKVSSFGIYEFSNYEGEETAAALMAQMIWYFVEGVNYRSNEINIKNQPTTLHYKVPIDDEILSFYKSSRTGRWWIEIPFIASGNNKLKRHTLLPCTYKDYEGACNQEMPERWYKAKQKNEV